MNWFTTHFKCITWLCGVTQSTFRNSEGHWLAFGWDPTIHRDDLSCSVLMAASFHLCRSRCALNTSRASLASAHRNIYIYVYIYDFYFITIYTSQINNRMCWINIIIETIYIYNLGDYLYPTCVEFINNWSYRLKVSTKTTNHLFLVSSAFGMRILSI